MMGVSYNKSMKKILLLGILAVIGLAYGIIQYLALDKNPLPPSIPEPSQESLQKNVPYNIVEVVRDLEIPWSIAFTSSERMLVTERPGRIRVIVNGILQKEPLMTIAEVSSIDEE